MSVEYKHLTISSTFKITAADIESMQRQAEWPLYEIDERWKSFCKFGPEDIGGVWEKLGAIRRRRVDLLVVADSMRKKIDDLIEQQILGTGNAVDGFGFPVVYTNAMGSGVYGITRQF